MIFTPIILAHVLAALAAIVIGCIMFALKKGTPVHRLFGRLWVAMMTAAALVSFGIKSNGHFSWIHLLSVWTLFAVSIAMISILRRNIRAHQRWMTGSYIGLVTAGVFTLLPNRRLGYLVWHSIGLV